MVSLPPGCVINNIRTGDNQIYVIISGMSQKSKIVCSRVVVVDTASGKRLGTIKVAP